MNDMSFGLVVEGLVSVLLVVTIVYCLIINRKLSALRSDQGKLKEIVQLLDRSTRNAENVMGELREAASQTQEDLDDRIEYGQSTLKRLNEAIIEANQAMSRLARPERAEPEPKASVSAPEKAVAVPRPAPVNRQQIKTEMRLSNLMRGQGAIAAPAGKPASPGRSRTKGSA